MALLLLPQLSLCHSHIQAFIQNLPKISRPDSSWPKLQWASIELAAGQPSNQSVSQWQLFSLWITNFKCTPPDIHFFLKISNVVAASDSTCHSACNLFLLSERVCGETLQMLVSLFVVNKTVQSFMNDTVKQWTHSSGWPWWHTQIHTRTHIAKP